MPPLHVVEACPFPARPVFVGRRRDLPAQVRDALGEMAERGEAFQASDALPPGPHPPFRRFVSAERHGCELRVRYEAGGIAHTWGVRRFSYRRGRWAAAATD